MKNPIEYYQKVLQTNPGDVNTQLRLAAAWRKHGRDDLALDLYVSAAQVLVRRGWALQAAAACKSVLEIDPAHRGIIDVLDSLAASGSGSVAQVAASIAATSRRKRSELESVGLVPPSSQDVPIPDDGRHGAQTVEIPFDPRALPGRAGSVPEPLASPAAEPIPSPVVPPSPAPPRHQGRSARTAFSTDTVNYALSPEERAGVMAAMARELEAHKDASQPDPRGSFRSVHEQHTVVGPAPTAPATKPPPATKPRVDLSPHLRVDRADDTVGGFPQLHADQLNTEPTGRANTAQTIVAHVSRATPPPPPSGGRRTERIMHSSRVAPSGPRTVPNSPALPPSDLLEGIPWDVTREVLERVGVRDLADGTSITDHFSRQLVFVVSGEVDIVVTNKDHVARVATRLGPGDFFGQGSILTGKSPTATAKAHGSAAILVIPESDVSNFAEYDDTLWNTLWHRHDRMILDTALSRSNLFGKMKLPARQRLAALFERYDVDQDQLVIGQGEAGHGMYLVLRGAVEVKRTVGIDERVLGVLREGKFFGTIKASASKAAVRAIRPSSLFVLVRESLVRVLRG